MCVIMSKPQGVAFPEERILKNCWDNNPDMGGFMYAMNDKVYINKGFKTWESFKNGLAKARKLTGDDVPYVCHFRISTQGYDTSCCQPFPLTSNMNKMKKNKAECRIGVAHNGVLSLTSDGATTYSDTMKFISDFLVNIIQSHDWYKNDRTLLLVDNLIKGSRFAILDKYGHCELRGKGWVEENGCHFSNDSYSYKKAVYPANYYNGYWDDWYGGSPWWSNSKKESKKEQSKKVSDDSTWVDNKAFDMGWDDWDGYWNESKGTYDFDASWCPYTAEDEDGYCECCEKFGQCTYTMSCGILKKA